MTYIKRVLVRINSCLPCDSYLTMIKSAAQYWNGVYFAILVFDVSNPDSFENVKNWSEELKKSRVDKERPIKAVLVATKTDLPSQRQIVSLDVAESWARSNGMDFSATSALPPGSDIDTPFVTIARALHKSYEERVASHIDASRNF